jgi:hypothetical protein
VILFLDVIFQVAVFQFSFHIFMPLANFCLCAFKDSFLSLRIRSYPLIRPPKRTFAVDRTRIFIPGFIRSPATLAVYDVELFLPLGGVDRDFPFTEDEIRTHFSYFSDYFR